uniref:Zf-C3Hc3H domain-containing protein n=1 Tax=Caenorhabditis tropicalis TaxID=1561998 RepID=A0A1I7TWP6_9PELO
MKQVARPPAQYLIADGSQYRLKPNEYDKNTYAQCNYTSNRTLIRCKQIRSKDSLSKNGGRCEEHLEFAKILETNHRKEVMRCHSENDTNMQRRRFDPWIASNGYISDEDDYLQPMQEAPQGIPETSNNNFLDNHPLRYAKTFTDKDILKIKMELVQQDIDDLTEFRRLLTSQAQREHESLGNDGEDDLPTDFVQRRLFKASAKYDRKDYLTLTTIDPVYKQCLIGPNMDDQLVVTHIIHSILDKIDNKETFSAEEQCTKSALPLSNFCIDHIRVDRHQKLFTVCTDCASTAIGGKEPKCSVHLKLCACVETSSCSCSKCEPTDSKDEKRKSETATSEEEETLGNLSKFESMVSPMTQFNSYLPSPSSSVSSSSSTNHSKTQRRYQGPSPAQILRPPQMGPPPGVTTKASYQNKNSQQRVVVSPLTPQQAHEQQQKKVEEEEARSQTCSRVRPIEPTQYGSGKKKMQQQQRLHNRPSTIGNATSAYQQHKKLIQGAWRSHQPTSSSSVGRALLPGQQNLYPIHSNRPHQHLNQPPPPKTIPLERTEDARETWDEQRFNLGPEPQRRGVPYYKNAAFRRTELPTRHAQHSQPAAQQLTPSTSTSSSQLLAPPQSPQSSSPSSSPHIYRPSQMSRLPMAPHRAIAAGLNPADVGGQRSPYRIQRAFPQSPQQQQFHQGGSMVNRRYSTAPTAGNQRLMAGGGRPPGGNYVIHGSSTPSSSSSGAPSVSTASPASEDSATTAGFSAMKSLDSARQDVRFANINVKTFLSMGNQNFEKMTKEEIEQMAAASESQEKPPRKNAHGAAAAAAAAAAVASGAGAQPARQNSRGYSARALNPKPKEPAVIPDAVQQVVSTPSIVSTGDMTTSGATFSYAKTSEEGRKRKLEDSATSPSVEPPAKKPIEEKLDKTPKKTPLTPSPVRTQRAAALAANQAIAHHKPPTPSTSTTTSSSSAPPENPLDLLAELSAAAEEEEVQRVAVAKKTPTKKTSSPSTVTQRRSSVGKKDEK